ncbi:U4/U6.U5 tri-snRNP-associated protein 1-like [Tachypleus tridentatus]|uniref:U4/U6.U5 tri-snRNP-associated protein 1-like n=1 Tax=Tachypleus tridentatus TaxID=6853 RepID=UPI003FD0F17B
MSGNREDEADEIMDFERELMEEQQLKELEAQNRGAWNEVDIDDKPVEINNQESIPILEEEPDVSTGMAAALQLAMKKGYLENEVKKPVSAQRHSDLQAQSYTIEEKFYDDDKAPQRSLREVHCQTSKIKKGTNLM